MKTLKEALVWANGGWRESKYCKTLNGNKGIDFDGQYGFQCKDFVNGYADYNGVPFQSGNAITLWTQRQTGWTKQTKPKKGDVHVMDYVSGGVNYGHTGVVVSVLPLGFYSVDQNWKNPSLTVGSPPSKVFHPKYKAKGFLRPKFAPEGPTITRRETWTRKRMYKLLEDTYIVSIPDNKKAGKILHKKGETFDIGEYTEWSNGKRFYRTKKEVANKDMRGYGKSKLRRIT